MSNINAKTKVFGVIGNPIGHTLSPFIHNTVAKEINRDLVYTAFKVTEAGLENAIKGAFELGIAGLNVTVPHKKAIMPYLYSLDTTAAAVGAVNTIKLTEKGYIGYNTDMVGVYYALKDKNIQIENKTVLILGAGGAANACVAMAASKGAKKIYVANRTIENAQMLCDHVSQYYKTEYISLSLSDISTLRDCNIVINATTLGFSDKARLTPITDLSFYANNQIEVVLDAIYSPWETLLLKQAQEQGVKNVINGFPMLVYQAIAAQEIWYDKELTPEFKNYIYQLLLNQYKENIYE